MEPKKQFHEVVAEKLIEQLKAGTAPWQKLWGPGEPNVYLPMNPTTGKRYKGSNAIYLMAQGRNDGRWMTYEQAKAAGAQVRKGEKGTPIQYWKFREEQDKLDVNGRPVLDAKGQPVKVTVMLERPRLFFATVFNGEQIDGLPLLQQNPQKEQTWGGNWRAEHILRASGADITHDSRDRAFYQIKKDRINLPERGQFPSDDSYYAAAMHVLGHWTGHSSRLDRDLSHPFGSEGYAKEELRAEIASMFLGDELGIGHDPEHHASYVNPWIKVLQNDPQEVLRAAADAEKVIDYILAFEQKQVQEQDQLQSLAQNNTQITNVQQRHVVVDGENVRSNMTLFDLYEAVFDSSRDEFVYHPKWVDENAATATISSREAIVEDLIGYADGFFGIDISKQQADSVVIAHARYLQQTQEDGQYEINFHHFVKEPLSKIDIGTPSVESERHRVAQHSKIDIGIPNKHPFDDVGDEEIEELKLNHQGVAQTRQYLAVPYVERTEARSAGARWDPSVRSWYVGPKGDMKKLERWIPENVGSQQVSAMQPREEFAEAMRSIGLKVEGDHPIMDGKKQRVPVEGGKAGTLDGFYVGHLDGHPAGRIINNKTGADISWKSKGYVLSDKEKAKLHAEAANKLAKRMEEQERDHESTAQRVAQQRTYLVPIVRPTPYLQAKDVRASAGVFTDREGLTTYIPAFDVKGKQWTMQYIQEDGTKRFAKDSKKEGCFHPVGGMAALAAAPVLVITEGYATAASVAEGFGYATASAFDSGNLLPVALALHKEFPDKPILIAGDDDKHQEARHGRNPGREKAEEAAKAVGGKAIFPTFAPGEQQNNPKGFTDFNDLANKSKLGRDGLNRQIKAAVNQALNEKKRDEQQLVVNKQQQIERWPRRVARSS